MNIEPECIPCAMKSFNRALGQTQLDNNAKMSEIQKFLGEIAAIDTDITPPELGRLVHRRIKHLLDDDDPFAADKAYYNNVMMDKYDFFRRMIGESDDKFSAALRLSLAGNVIDFGVLSRDGIEALLRKSSDLDPAIDDSARLDADLRSSGRILYLGDNSGEIVFDRLLIETILDVYGRREIYFAVRGFPIINDITRADAELVGIDKIVPVIDNGYDAPGTILRHAGSEFRKIFDSADLIISKGQGNFESLSGSERNIYFLLTAKCEVVARYFGVANGSPLVAHISGLK
jgi:hypothetical protein